MALSGANIARLCCLAAAFATLLTASGGQQCAACHPKEVRQYALTGMARSLTVAADQPSGAFVHNASGTRFEVRSSSGTSSGTMTQSAERGGIRAQYPVAYVIGSGNHAYAYLIRIADFLFQSPISYYSTREVWDMAPGFERDREPDFTRPVSAECLLCHAGSSFPATGINRYTPPYVGEMGISCDRCHGPTRAHLLHPSRANIVNPARLSAKARDSVCEQCHLTGEARVPNPGRTLADFQAGQELESAFSVYVFDRTGQAESDASIKVVSHAEQLRKSACARGSEGRLWCGTCHDPHNEPVDKATYYRDRCLSCHNGRLPSAHPAASENCVACHMPSRPAKDGGHTAFTDHRISRDQNKLEAAAPMLANTALAAWREPDSSVAARNLALAYLAVGERNDSGPLLDKAAQLLTRIEPSFASDAEVLNGLAIVMLRQGRKSDAVKTLERALKLVPSSATYRINLATALLESGNPDAAITHLNRAIELDPSLEVAYRRLVEVYGKKGDSAGVRQTFQRYLAFRPQSIGARAALRKP